MEVVASQPDPAPDLENATSDGFKLVTPEHIEHLYKKYSFITKVFYARVLSMRIFFSAGCLARNYVSGIGFINKIFYANST